MNNITVYTTTQCPYCTLVKKFLVSNNLSFQEVNLEQQPDIVQHLVQKTGRIGVPQTEINGTWIVGYNPTEIMKVLNNQ